MINSQDMMKSRTIGSAREAVGIFQSKEELDAAIAELEITAFPRQDISVLSREADIKDKMPDMPAEWLENTVSERGVSIRPEEKTIGATVFIGGCAYLCGTVAAVQFGMASTAGLIFALGLGSIIGGLIGALIIQFVAVHMARRTERQIRNGGLLLWVRTPEPEKENIAKNIMKKHGGRDVHIHEI